MVRECITTFAKANTTLRWRIGSFTWISPTGSLGGNDTRTAHTFREVAGCCRSVASLWFGGWITCDQLRQGFRAPRPAACTDRFQADETDGGAGSRTLEKRI